MNRFFQYINTFPMPLWLAMMFLPDHPWTVRASRSSTIAGLAALHYVAALGAAATQRDQPAGSPADMLSLEGVRRLLGTPGGALASWAHMLALDLFTGAWIYRECRRLQAPALVRITALFFTLMSGPFGLFIFLVWRAIGARQGEALP
jgi:hypothetical protein